MPLVYMPAIRESISRPLEMDEKNLIYSLCALTSTHMSGKIIVAPGPQSWDTAGRFFLDQCISVRQSYDFVEDKSLSAVISSYFVSTAFFELNQNRKSWYYLREALTMGQDLGFHDESSYVDLSPEEALCHRRTFWILYVTERYVSFDSSTKKPSIIPDRSFAILRNKPLTLSKAPKFPTTLHEYEAPEIHSGFMHLINTYHLLDAAFVDTWNECTQAPTSTTTYTLLQERLNIAHPISMALTSIQRADILVTQQWLRLIVWQSSMRQGLLSSASADESMTFHYPFRIAHSLLTAISSLPSTAVDVHGMGIFEKIFEIANTTLDVIQACGTGSEMVKYGICQDPFGVFVRTLSSTPKSQKQYANLLLEKVAEKPEIARLSSGLWSSNLTLPCLVDGLQESLTIVENDDAASGSARVQAWKGSIIGEVCDDVKVQMPKEYRPTDDTEISTFELSEGRKSSWETNISPKALEEFDAEIGKLNVT
ncbi:hypothetical protein/Fungal trans superfamily [Blumeria hordei DH14]|uniref:Xylanolytic transcriptional activator regulatory domain-containing protein n=1 Tax=Blumeria graminis f. sp. hordei (strain DH14) TaxID=546991 RepID=N1J5Z2_BLUG1|nr:hypothetical protein/Fungal trans superfamily [Blumeria hordei DH14]